MNEPSSQQQSISIPRPDFNKWEYFTIVPGLDSPNSKGPYFHEPEGSPGVYETVFILSIPGSNAFLSEVNLDRIIKSGESLVALPPASSYGKVDFSGDLQGSVTLFKNDKNELARIAVRVNARDFKEANRLSHEIVMSLLSSISFELDVAIGISAFETTETATNVKSYGFGMVGKQKVLNIQVETVRSEHRTLLSTYREGLNATSIFYQALCFWKVIEGVKNNRNLLQSQARSNGKTYRSPKESIPYSLSDLSLSDEFDEPLFKPFLGKRFSAVCEQYREVIRNSIAHIDPERESLSSDKQSDISKCEDAIPVLKYISRKMLVNLIKFDSVE